MPSSASSLSPMRVPPPILGSYSWRTDTVRGVLRDQVWLPRAPRRVLAGPALIAGAALAALVPLVFFLKL